MFGNRKKTSTTKPAVTLPVWGGPGIAPCCQVGPGQDHNLSCEHVSPELFFAFLGIEPSKEQWR
ncbi:hypothetical protein ABZ949_02090 [Micromonospora tulbaghiae]|uniref:hypothetical protein n=1 Tax=Micromonospora tulbaghiae TaxID=479978 RepID=UPI0033F1B7AC